MPITKKCKDCGVDKGVADFYPTQGECKECSKKRVRKNWDNKRGYYEKYDKKRIRENFNYIFLHRYSGLKARVEGRAIRKYKVEGMDICTKEEFIGWCKENLSEFKILHSKWKESKYNTKLIPSIDRKNNNVGYLINNLQWISKSDNSKKYTK